MKLCGLKGCENKHQAMEVCQKHYRKHFRPSSGGPPEPITPDMWKPGRGPENNDRAARLEEAKVRKAELEVEEKEGSVVKVAEMRRQLSESLGGGITALDNASARIRQNLASLDLPDIEAVMDVVDDELGLIRAAFVPD